jgi:hypothetical protein
MGFLTEPSKTSLKQKSRQVLRFVACRGIQLLLAESVGDHNPPHSGVTEVAAFQREDETHVVKIEASEAPPGQIRKHVDAAQSLFLEVLGLFQRGGGKAPKRAARDVGSREIAIVGRIDREAVHLAKTQIGVA